MPETTIRPGTVEDSYAVFYLFEETLADLMVRLGMGDGSRWSEPEKLARMWSERQPLYEYLARSAEYFWVAEQAGQIVGFARTVFHDGVRELTEYFVKPGAQSAGVGKKLLERAFPTEGAQSRLIIASLDSRAQARYMKLGVYPQFPLYYFWRKPQVVPVVTDLVIRPLVIAPEMLAILDTIDKTIIGFRRPQDHQWLAADRQGWLYYRDGQPVGYGYTGRLNGPFALLEAQDYPAVLAHAEGIAAANHPDHFGVEIPMINRAAAAYLLAQGFQMDRFVALFMWDKPLGNLANYICTSPPFFL